LVNRSSGAAISRGIAGFAGARVVLDSAALVERSAADAFGWLVSVRGVIAAGLVDTAGGRKLSAIWRLFAPLRPLADGTVVAGTLVGVGALCDHRAKPPPKTATPRTAPTAMPAGFMRCRRSGIVGCRATSATGSAATGTP